MFVTLQFTNLIVRARACNPQFYDTNILIFQLVTVKGLNLSHPTLVINLSPDARRARKIPSKKRKLNNWLMQRLFYIALVFFDWTDRRTKDQVGSLYGLFPLCCGCKIV